MTKIEDVYQRLKVKDIHQRSMVKDRIWSKTKIKDKGQRQRSNVAMDKDQKTKSYDIVSPGKNAFRIITYQR